MEINNETPFPLFCHRDHLDDRFALVDATVKITYDSVDGGWRVAREQLPIESEPSLSLPMGDVPYLRPPDVTEVTVTGTVRAPGARPFAEASVMLRVGEQLRALRVLGRRWWRKRGTELEASEPEPVDTVPMSWAHAYGGAWDRAPGLLPGTETPAPSTRMACSANPLGKGWVIDASEAEGVELPQIEDPNEPIRRWNDRPSPKCWAPLPVESSLRMSHLVVEGGKLNGRDGEPPWPRMLLNASPDLQLERVAPGTPLDVRGLGEHPLTGFIVPSPAVAWHVAAGSRSRSRSPELVAIRIDADSARIALVWHARLHAPLVRGERRVFTLHAAPGLARTELPV